MGYVAIVINKICSAEPAPFVKMRCNTAAFNAKIYFYWSIFIGNCIIFQTRVSYPIQICWQFAAGEHACAYFSIISQLTLAFEETCIMGFNHADGTATVVFIFYSFIFGKLILQLHYLMDASRDRGIYSLSLIWQRTGNCVLLCKWHAAAQLIITLAVALLWNKRGEGSGRVKHAKLISQKY